MKEKERMKSSTRNVDIEVVDGGIYTTKERKDRYKSELGKLKRSLKHIDKKDLKIAEVLIKNMAFITVQMEELALMVEADGYLSVYQNGANQVGVKKSVPADLYTVSCKNYAVLFGKLQAILPKEEKVPELDPLDEFKKEKKK